MVRLRKIPALAAIILLATAADASAQDVKVYSGTGTAILGTGMTPEETEKLALDAARRDALQKFGTYVRSEDTLLRTSGGSKNWNETFTQETQVISASIVRLKEGTKSVERNPEGETLRFVVSAKFEIDKERFNKRVNQFQNAPKDSELRELVDRSVQVESKLQESDDAEVRKRLQLQSLDLREQIGRSMQRIGGSQVSSEIMERRRQKRELLNEYVRLVAKYGHPYSIVDIIPKKEPSFTDQDDKVKINAKYEIMVSDDGDKEDLKESLENLLKGWSGEIAQEWSPSDISKVKQHYVFALVGIDINGNIVFLDPLKTPLTIDYEGYITIDNVSKYRNDYDWYSFGGSGESITTFYASSKISFEMLRRVESINFIITRFGSKRDAKSFMEDEGFEAKRKTRYVPGRHDPPRDGPPKVYIDKPNVKMSVDRVTLTKETFRKQIKGEFKR